MLRRETTVRKHKTSSDSSLEPTLAAFKGRQGKLILQCNRADGT